MGGSGAVGTGEPVLQMDATGVQPVAPAYDRSVCELLGDLRSGGIFDRLPSVQEEMALRRWAKAQEQAGLRRIEQHLSRGSEWAAKREARKLRAALGPRLLALWRTSPKYLRTKTVMTPEDHELIRRTRLWLMFQLVGRVGSFSAPVSARVFAKRKGDHKPGAPSRRALFSFGWDDKARQSLLATTLMPFASFHPSQFLLQRHDGKRGRSAVCRALLEALRGLTDTHVFVQLDVRNFYGSIRHDWLETHLSLSQEIIRRHVHTSRMMISWDRSALAHLTDGVRSELARRGIPQGSALSPLIAEMVMADVLRGLADRLDGVRLFTYSDNLGIIVPRAEAGAVVELLRDAFARHDAGPFELTHTTPAPVTAEFKFLGLWWTVAGGEGRAFVPEVIACQRAMLIIQDAIHGRPADRERLRARANGQAAAWMLWPGAKAWGVHVLNGIEASTMPPYRKPGAFPPGPVC